MNEAFTTNRGPHTLKFGGLFVRPVNHVVETQNQNGRYTMPSVALFNAANPATYPIGYAISFEPGEHPGWAWAAASMGCSRKTPGAGAGVDAVTRPSLRRGGEGVVHQCRRRRDATAVQHPLESRQSEPGQPRAAGRIHVGAWRHDADGDSRRLRDVLRHGQERHVCGVGRAGRQSSPAGWPAHEHRLEQRDAESLLPRQHPVRRRCAGRSPECVATGDGLRDHQQHRAKPVRPLLSP